MSDINEKYSDEVEKLLEVGKEKEYLTYDDINRLLPPDMNSADEIEAILDVIGAEGISISDSDEKFIEAAASAIGSNGDGKLEDALDEVLDLDLTPGTLDKTNDPVRLYLREMAVVPLLTRDGEVSIARRIERGRQRVGRIDRQRSLEQQGQGPDHRTEVEPADQGVGNRSHTALDPDVPPHRLEQPPCPRQIP